MMKIIHIILGVGILFIYGCSLSDVGSKTDKEIFVDPPTNDCFITCSEGQTVSCEGGCPIEEKLSETAKNSCLNSDGKVVIKNKNEVCQCSPTQIEKAFTRFSPIYGCNVVCISGFRLENNQCIEIPSRELCENSDGICSNGECECPPGSIGFTESFGCDYRITINSVFNIIK